MLTSYYISNFLFPVPRIPNRTQKCLKKMALRQSVIQKPGGVSWWKRWSLHTSEIFLTVKKIIIKNTNFDFTKNLISGEVQHHGWVLSSMICELDLISIKNGTSDFFVLSYCFIYLKNISTWWKAFFQKQRWCSLMKLLELIQNFARNHSVSATTLKMTSKMHFLFHL